MFYSKFYPSNLETFASFCCSHCHLHSAFWQDSKLLLTAAPFKQQDRVHCSLPSPSILSYFGFLSEVWTTALTSNWYPSYHLLTCIVVAVVQSQSPIWLFCNSMSCSLPGSSVHVISQARKLEWVAIFFSRGSSWPKDQTSVSYIGRRIPYLWTTTEAHQPVYSYPNKLPQSPFWSWCSPIVLCIKCCITVPWSNKWGHTQSNPAGHNGSSECSWPFPTSYRVLVPGLACDITLHHCQSKSGSPCRYATQTSFVIPRSQGPSSIKFSPNIPDTEYHVFPSNYNDHTLL